ncbi:MAG: adenylosuccinate synthetase [Patescibacteria group bacterium]|jgi:adenylosuccinate synthase
MSHRGVNHAVVGVFAGDESKGKETDRLGRECSIVARFEGGANAGHTIKVGDFEFVGHLLPSGAAAGARCVLARGVRVDPIQLLAEIKEFQEKGGKLQSLGVDAGCFLSFEWHRSLELWVEQAKGVRMAYTTMRGMCGIAGSIGFRLNAKVGMLYHPDELLQWLKDFYEAFRPVFEHPELGKHLENPPLVKRPREMADELLGVADALAPYVTDVRGELLHAWNRGASILWEGAQGLMLDPYWGTWGFNTQGMCTFAGIPQGSGLPVTAIGTRIGVNKLVASRVGNGPFVTELGDYAVTQQEERIPKEQREAWCTDMLAKINGGHATDQEIGQYLRVTANEYGATSGRPRRTGWFDCTWQVYFCDVNDPDELVLSKLDCLSGLNTLRICIGYELDGQQLPQGCIPELAWEYARVQPQYLELPGWEEDITGETKFEKLPLRAQEYIRAIERHGGHRIDRIGTGPDRDHMIIR